MAAAMLLAVLPQTGWAVDPAVLAAEAKRIGVASRLAPSVVAIFSRGGQGGGSGVLISPDGYALTNFHVTRGAGTFMKCGLNNGQLYDAVIVGIDPTGDVALVKLLGRDDFHRSSSVELLELVLYSWTEPSSSICARFRQIYSFWLASPPGTFFSRPFYFATLLFAEVHALVYQSNYTRSGRVGSTGKSALNRYAL